MMTDSHHNVSDTTDNLKAKFFITVIIMSVTPLTVTSLTNKELHFKVVSGVTDIMMTVIKNFTLRLSVVSLTL
jgi:hypothetical protein